MHTHTFDLHFIARTIHQQKSKGEGGGGELGMEIAMITPSSIQRYIGYGH